MDLTLQTVQLIHIVVMHYLGGKLNEMLQGLSADELKVSSGEEDNLPYLGMYSLHFSKQLLLLMYNYNNQLVS